MKLFRLRNLVVVVFCLLGGCTTASRSGGMTTYSIGGTPYVSLIPLCDLSHFGWEYDPLTRTFEFVRPPDRITLQVGSSTVFVNSAPRTLAGPVQVHRGMVMVPDQFRRSILGPLTGRATPTAESLSFYGIKKVVIDPGHGGKDPGAVGKGGLYEKNVVLDIGKRLAAILRRGGIEVVMTRTGDRFIPLEQRARMTENSRTDLFISIHANANRVRSLSGFEVYYVAPKTSDAERARAAAKTLSLGEYRASMANPDPVLKAILWDMIYAYNKTESVQLSKKICDAIGRNLECRVIGTKGANFCVLRSSCVPAILVEVGFVSNQQEERLLGTGSYRQKIAEALGEGVREYARSIARRDAADKDEFALRKSNEERQ
jgi:N-acetylmuramoyl-L-alanine amidase